MSDVVLARLLATTINDEALPCWPLTWGVPLAAGRVQMEEALVVVDGAGKPLATQCRALAWHEDGSVRQLLVTTEAALDRVSEHEFALCVGAPPEAVAGCVVTSDRLGGAVGEWVLRDGELWLVRDGLRLRAVLAASGGAAGEALEELSGEWTDWTVVERGPVRGVVVVSGRLCDCDGEAVVQVRLTLRVHAQTPTVSCDLEVMNRSRHELLELGQLGLSLVSEAAVWKGVQYEVRHLLGPYVGELPLDVRSDRLTVRAGAAYTERRLLNYNETWLSLSGAVEQCVVSVRDFFECYPYGVELREDGVCLGFWPDWYEGHTPLRRGSGKTHTFALGFCGLEAGDWPQAFGYACVKEPLCRVAWDDLQVAEQWADMLAYEPDTYPRVESTLYDIMYNRNRGYGKLNYGDDYSALYTSQGRGAGKIVWNNLEGDYPYHMFCQYQRTGQYIYWKEFVTGIRHWADVDFCDLSDDPLREGALVIHSHSHNSGGCQPCHNWAEGFREWYFATGDPRPLEILDKMGDWLLRQEADGFFDLEPQPYVRGCGWGLIQLTAIYEVLPRADLGAFIRRLCEALLGYCRAHDGLPMRLPTGGTHVPMDNAFHTATVTMGAERAWRIFGIAGMRELALASAQVFMDGRTCSPEGIAVYISGPEQDFPMQQSATFAIAALATAYRLEGDERYLRRAMRMLEYCLDRGMIVDHGRVPGEFLEQDGEIILSPQMLMPNTQLSSYQLRGVLQLMKGAHEAGFLKQIEYRF